jgi:hypothetical protein
VGTWHDLNVGRPIAAPLERCAELLGVELAGVHDVAANVEPYIGADGTEVWSLCRLSGNYAPRRSAGARQAPA